MGYFRGKPRGQYFVPRQGIDLSNVRPATPEIKFRSGATIGYNFVSGEWEKGIKILETLSEGTLSGEYKGKYGRGVEIAIDTTSTRDGHPQGGMNDQGLACDGNGLPAASLNPHYERQRFSMSIMKCFKSCISITRTIIGGFFTVFSVNNPF